MATAGSVAVIQESLFADGGGMKNMRDFHPMARGKSQELANHKRSACTLAARGAQTSTAFGVGTTVLSVLLGTVAMLAKARIATDIDYYVCVWR
jgi:hypothetical protein